MDSFVDLHHHHILRDPRQRLLVGVATGHGGSHLVHEFGVSAAPERFLDAPQDEEDVM